MKIIFFSQETYPEGGAACNRHLAYMEALTSRGHEVVLYAIGRQGLSYERSFLKIVGIEITASNRLLFHIKSFFAIVRLCLRLNKRKRQELRWVYLGTSGLLLLPLLVVAIICRIKIFHERTELPSLMVGAGLLNKLDHLLYKSLLGWFSGIFVISKALQGHIRQQVGVDAKVDVVNMIVDLSRFHNHCTGTSSFLSVITYCGDLSSPKDGVDILIRAFAMACKSAIDQRFTLKLAGSLNNKYTQNILIPLVDELGISGKVDFLGQVCRDEVPSLLCRSDLLVLARPSSEQASYGFPTKLGEYLASKKPVLVTNTGEISLYLSDGVDAFFVEPNEIEAFADRILEISRNYQDALIVGRNGYAAAVKYFSALSAAERIEKILNYS